MAARAEGERVLRVEDLDAALDRALALEQPYVVDVKTPAEASPTLGLRDVSPCRGSAQGSSYET